MTREKIWISDAERRQIAEMLRDGHSALEIHRRTGRSAYAVRQIRDESGIPPVGSVRTAAAVRPHLQDEEEVGSGSGDPWIPPRGYDVYMERPSQARWRAMCAAAGRDETRRLRAAMCTVLGLSALAADDIMVQRLIAEKRTAEELAGLYLEAAR